MQDRSPWTFKDGANGGGPLDFPSRRNRSHLETSGRRGRASRSPGLTRAKRKPTGLSRRGLEIGGVSAKPTPRALSLAPGPGDPTETIISD